MTDDFPQCVLWADPGLTTGLSWIELTESGYVFDCAQETGTEAAASRVDEILGYTPDGRGRANSRRVWVGWEQYIVTAGGGKSGNPAPSLEVIGAMKWLCHEAGARVLAPVPASHRIVASPALLKELGWWRPGMPHAQDAARHLVAWLLREKQARRIRR